MISMTNKALDAVEMSRELRQQTAQKLAAMTRSEKLALLNGHMRQTAGNEAPDGLLRTTKQ